MPDHHRTRNANGVKVAEQLTVRFLPTSVSMPAHNASTTSYGVSRVFNQQCGYILSDAQVAQANMRALINAVKTSELDPNAGKAR